MNKGRDNKPHIGIFGRRNVGKSSLINVLTGHEVAIVSELAGTTTDPVKKSIEIFGIGPAIIIDTAGIDDTGELGGKRIQKSIEVIKQVDCGILMIAENCFGEFEINLIEKFNKFEVPFLIIHNKSDLQPLYETTQSNINVHYPKKIIEFSTSDHVNLEEVVDLISNTIPATSYQKISMLENIVKPGDTVLMVTPIDSEAPEGRMILPQVMTLRDILDNDCIAIVLKETQLEKFFKSVNIKPNLVITDSQAFALVNSIVPASIPLTGFSVVFAKMRGDFEAYKNGTPKLSHLQDNDRVLILESCTHQISCEDIGRHKLPEMILGFSEKKILFDVVPGLNNLQRPISDYSMLIQCGGCVVTKKQLSQRLKPAIDAGIPVSNYGMAIAWINGIYERAIEPFNKLK